MAKIQDDSRYVDISMKIDKFFSGVKYELEWAKSRSGKVGVLITYTDFLSEGLAKRMLADVVPGDIRVLLKREYSDEAVARLMVEEYKKNCIAVVDCGDGSIVTEPFASYVHRRLEAVELIQPDLSCLQSARRAR